MTDPCSSRVRHSVLYKLTSLRLKFNLSLRDSARVSSPKITHQPRVVLILQGNTLLPDFFLDEANPEKILKDHHNMAKLEAIAGSSTGNVAKVFETIKSLCDEELVKTINGIFEFDIHGKDAGSWYLDLKNAPGK